MTPFIENVLLITSNQNPKIKQALHLQDKRARDKSGTFLIEGFRETSRALENGVSFLEFFFCPELFLGEHERELLEKAKERGAQLLQLPSHLFSKLSYRDRPDGLLAIAKKNPLSLKEAEQLLTTKQNPLIVIAESIEKPGNLGTILRSSDAAGVDLLIVANSCTDIYNPNVVRASTGTLFTVPVVEASNEETLALLQKLHIQPLAATPSGKMLYWDAPLRQPIAILMGTEQLGLSPFWMNQDILKVKIPMLGKADSLNVAQATTLFLFEAVRQRHATSHSF